MTIFGLGPCGNINPPEVGITYSAMKDLAKTMAATLTDAVLSSLAGDHLLSDILRFDSKVIRLTSAIQSKIDISSYAEKHRFNEAAAKEFGAVYSRAIEQWELNMKAKFMLDEVLLPIEIFSLVIGDLVIMGISAETFSSIATLAPQHTNHSRMIITCANGSQGYLSDLHAYRLGGYETHTSYFFYNNLPPAAGSLERLAEEFKKMLSV